MLKLIYLFEISKISKRIVNRIRPRAGRYFFVLSYAHKWQPLLLNIDQHSNSITKLRRPAHRLRGPAWDFAHWQKNISQSSSIFFIWIKKSFKEDIKLFTAQISTKMQRLIRQIESEIHSPFSMLTLDWFKEPANSTYDKFSFTWYLSDF